ncbi:MAG: aminotransferase class I/II-fold pyridoxal phosphate-dependent enzyme [Acidimicrobiales bacterium]
MRASSDARGLRFRKTLPIPPRLHACHRINASFGDALWALVAVARRRAVAVPVGDALVCLSVRSAWDLLLSALDLPPGEKVLVTAITHPDMARIAELHGLVVVPVDVDPDTLAPVGLAATPPARILLVAHLFGARLDLGPAVAFTRRYGLLLVEDCAQAMQSAHDRGDPRADVSLFSFGFIKTATALGGALAAVRDPGIAARMAAIHDGWPLQRRREYGAKALKCLVALAVSGPRAYAVVSRVTDVGGLVRTIRGGDAAALTAWLRRRPCAGLLAMLRRRLNRFPAERVRRRAEAGEGLAAALPPGLSHPGGAALDRTHWLFPVVTADPEKLIARLRAAGFDASRGSSQIAALAPAPCAERLMAAMVFLPAHPELPPAERRRLIAELHAGV